MKVTVLMENTSDSNLYHEHGLSFLIETKYRYLLDAGISGKFMNNAKSLGANLDLLDYVVLSHGHFDHGDGFESFLQVYPNTKILAQKTVFDSYYSTSHHKLHYIGLNKRDFDHYQLLDGSISLNEEATLLRHQNTMKDTGLYKRVGDQYQIDSFDHEQSLVFNTSKGLIIFNSCSHHGIVPIIQETLSYFHTNHVYAYIGGLHLKAYDEKDQPCCSLTKEEMKEMCDFLTDVKLQYLYTGHCTGEIGFDYLKEILGDCLIRLKSGLVFEL